MKIKLLLLCIVAFITACERPGPEYPIDPNNPVNPESPNIIRNAVKDVDGNNYDAICIGNQVWMSTNLKTTRYSDGTAIPMGEDGDVYHDHENDIYYPNEPRRYYPNGNESNVNDYGYLYNWQAVMNGCNSSTNNPSGIRGVCPQGWHVPSTAEWEELRIHLSELDDSNSFFLFPAGNRSGNYYSAFDKYPYFWTTTECAINSAYYYYFSSVIDLHSLASSKTNANTVRCIRD